MDKGENMKQREISAAVIRRLPRYYRYLGELLQHDVVRISSKELSNRMKVTASQIRQDLNNFGGFGQQGYGYNVEYLHNEIGKILGLDVQHNMIIIGAGNLGQALANYNFEKVGYHLIGIFDTNPRLKGVSVRGIEIYMMDMLDEFVATHQVDVVTLTVPKRQAVEIGRHLEQIGIKAIWNFAPVHLDVPENILVQNQNMATSLAVLSMHLQAQIKVKK